jgi:acetyl-CoA synthase
MKKILSMAKELLPGMPAEEAWLPYLGNTLDAGVAALFACEIIEACKYVTGPHPVNGIWLGAANDNIMRERGIEFVDGTAPGFAAITGAAPTNEIAVKIAKELQQKNLYVFMAGCTDGKQFAEQLAEEGMQLGWETRLVPYGRDVSALIYALGFANRAALSFGGVKPGDFKANLKYNKERIFAFVLAFGEVTPDKYAAAAGSINYGFPVIADTNIPEILPTGICTYEHVVSNVPYDTMVEKSLEVRGCKIKVSHVPIPVAYGPAFEGERIRKADTYVEFGGNRTPAFEFVTSVDMELIEDGEIEIVGRDIDDIEPGDALPLGIWVEVAGRKMQTDFEPILERQIHHLVNSAEGIWHMGQRDIIWTRISKSGYKNGLRLRHYGEIIHTRFLSDYPAIVDKVKITLITDPSEVEKRLDIARKTYNERNRRIESMTDESVDIFYSCLLCQSFAPNHVCIITPERLGLCGAYNWLDGKAAHEIDETGPNQPVKKGHCIDPVRGIWEGINEYVYKASHKSIESFSAYSIMYQPMTSCGCFEAICAYVPELNGVMVVNRDYTGDTPVGMTFSTLAGNVGGGQQTPGFIGVGKVYLVSRKFLFADGGFKRLVWMPKELKTLLEPDLRKRFDEIGMPDLWDKIADETLGIDTKVIREFMEKQKHPALEMDDMQILSEPAVHEKAGTEKKHSVESVTSGIKADLPSQKPLLEDEKLTADHLLKLKNMIAEELKEELKASVMQEVINEIIGNLSQKFMGEDTLASADVLIDSMKKSYTDVKEDISEEHTAGKRIGGIKSFTIPKEKCEEPIWQVRLGATKKEGGTRGKTYFIGGHTCMPFHLWEGEMPNRPLVAMEVFDTVGEKYPAILKSIYGDLLNEPEKMARLCVEKFGADVISVRLDGTHPERGDRTAEQSVKLIKSILAEVDVPLIITGHSHYEKINEVMKSVAQTFAGENLLLNWVEQDNYRTIAGAALAYGHCLVAQSPIDVNIGKQLNILLTNMDVKKEQIVMDTLTGAIGYGIEYTYSVMERIRLTGLGGDKILAAPMIISPGFECSKIKEYKAAEKDFPVWGDLKKRSYAWELSTALTLLYSGADILIMYHPEAATAIKKTIFKLMDGRIKE